MKKIVFIVFLALNLFARPDNFEYEKNCSNGDKFSCLDLGMFLFYDKKDTQAKEFLNKACDFKLIAGCDLLAHILDDEGKSKEALDKFIKTCDQNSSYGCLNAGILTKDENLTLAKEYLKKACELKDIHACGLLSVY